jgi:hypothetical protein
VILASKCQARVEGTFITTYLKIWGVVWPWSKQDSLTTFRLQDKSSSNVSLQLVIFSRKRGDTSTMHLVNTIKVSVKFLTRMTY